MRAFGGGVGFGVLPTRKSLPGVFSVNDHFQMIGEDRAPTVRDPLFANVSHLIHATSVIRQGQFWDSSLNARTVFQNNNTLNTLAIDRIFVGNNFLTNAVADCLDVVDVISGTGDFTIEFFIAVHSLAAAINILDCRPSGTNGLYPTIYTNTTGTVAYSTNSATKITSTATITAGIPAHICYQRSGGNLGRLAVNGVSAGTWADTTNYTNNVNINYGGSRFNTTTGQTSMVFDECRLTRAARYTFPFTVPTSRFPDY